MIVSSLWSGYENVSFDYFIWWEREKRNVRRRNERKKNEREMKEEEIERNRGRKKTRDLDLKC